MKMNTPTCATFPAVLARPLVAVFDVLTDAFPVWCVFPFGDAALPCGILFAADTATPNQGFREGAGSDSRFTYGLRDCGCTHTKLSSNLVDGAQLLDIFNTQPFGIMAQHLGAIVSRCVLRPTALFANPRHRSPTPTSTQRCGAGGLIDWFARAVLTCFGLSAGNPMMFLEQVAHVGR